MPHTEPSEGAARPARAEILDAASALFDEGGAEGLTIRRLTLRSGYTPPAIYHEFGDKAGLLEALLERAFHRVVDRLDREQEVAESDDALLRRLYHEMVSFGREHPELWRLLEVRRPEKAQLVVAFEAARKRIEAPLERMAERGEFRVELEVARQSLWALLHGVISLPRSRPDVEWRSEMAEIAFDALLSGLLTDPRANGGSA